MPITRSILMLSLSLSLVGIAHAVKPISDTPFIQEYHEPYPIQPEQAGDDVRAVAVDPSGVVWAATGGGLWSLRDGAWSRQEGITEGSAFDVYVEPSKGGSIVWVAAWDGLYSVSGGTATKHAEVTGPVSVVGPGPDGIVALGPNGSWMETDGEWSELEGNWSRNLHDVTTGPNGHLWVATHMGLYKQSDDGLRRFSQPDELYSAAVNGIAFAPDGRLWVGSWGGISVLENDVCVDQIIGEDGLPWWNVTCMAFAPDGTLWAGTTQGVSRYKDSPEWIARNNGSKWSHRHSRRWLLSDDVRSIAFDREGTAWIGTSKGVSAIKRRTLTLAEKAEYYQQRLEERHVRPPGFVEKCRYPDPTDRSVWEPVDDDNDGEYTSLYMIMESMRYAVTKDPQAKANADRAYEALEYLRVVTDSDGFFARTVVPSTWETMADMNEDFTDEQIAERLVRDPRWKPVEKRWRLSSDGKWYWKGDTSSDEIVGHFAGYLFYHDLVADDARKERVANHVKTIMDHVIRHDYTLTDPIDGKPTRWGVWTPEILHTDQDWWVEGQINAVEMMSFLKLTHYLTGEAKYERLYEKWLDMYNFKEIARRPKAPNRSEWSHIDDTIMAEIMPVLLQKETDSELRERYMEGFTWSYRMVENDQNPWFNFTYGMLGGENFQLTESVEFLRDQPLDLIQWQIDNSFREDIDLVRNPMQEPLQTSRMLPPSERGVMRWDKNPWAHISGDFSHPEGILESSGVFWLLPYWMGRYCGFIEAPME